jgi:hypothetical protein
VARNAHSSPRTRCDTRIALSYQARICFSLVYFLIRYECRGISHSDSRGWCPQGRKDISLVRNSHLTCFVTSLLLCCFFILLRLYFIISSRVALHCINSTTDYESMADACSWNKWRYWFFTRVRNGLGLRVEVKSSCFTKHHTMNTYGSGSIAPRILNLGTRWRWVVSFMHRPLYPRGRMMVALSNVLDAVANRTFPRTCRESKSGCPM